MTRIVEKKHLEQRFLDNGGADFQGTAVELEKFFHLTRKSDAPLAMINPNIDALWHTFLEFSEDYADYCCTEFNEFIHHRPRTAQTPVPASAVTNFIAEYEHEYGALPDIWLNGTPPEILAFATKKAGSLPNTLKWSGWPGRS